MPEGDTGATCGRPVADMAATPHCYSHARTCARGQQCCREGSDGQERPVKTHTESSVSAKASDNQMSDRFEAATTWPPYE